MMESLLFTAGSKSSGHVGEWTKVLSTNVMNQFNQLVLDSSDNLYVVGGVSGGAWQNTIRKLSTGAGILETVGIQPALQQAPIAWIDGINKINYNSSDNVNAIYSTPLSNLNATSTAGSISAHEFYRRAINFTGGNPADANNKTFFIGNTANTSLYVYDRTNNLHSIANNSMPIHGQHAAAVLLNDVIYIFGGNGQGATNAGNVKLATAYNILANTVTPLAPMPTAKHGAAAIAIDSDTIHLIGGSELADVKIAQTLDSIYEYKISTNEWRVLETKFPIKLVFGGYASNGNVGYIMGGYNELTGSIYKINRTI